MNKTRVPVIKPAINLLSLNHSQSLNALVKAHNTLPFSSSTMQHSLYNILLLLL